MFRKRFFVLAVMVCAAMLGLAAQGRAATYFLSATGNDSNSGTSSGSPWLSPNHALNCGDVIIAAASASYSNNNFVNGKWGTVTCAGGNNVAWLECATFDACKSSGSGSGFLVDKSYWGIQGFEVTQTGLTSCFLVYPDIGNVHHVIFANDVANGCEETGFGSTQTGTAQTDYLAFIGDIAYNAAQNTGSVCGQGFSIYGPYQSDSTAGTHMFVAGNFAWDNLDNAACNGSSPTDGEGIELDTWNLEPYCQQAVVENNIFIFNGGRGINLLLSACGNTYVRNNTLYGNNTDTHQGSLCGEFVANGWTGSVSMTLNIAMTVGATTCNGATAWDYGFINSGTAITMSSGIGYSAAGHNCTTVGGTFSCSGFPPTTSNPGFAGAANPGAPNCSGKLNTVDCMSTVIANFTPSGGAVGYGYQIPSGTSAFDPLFPQWLCNVTLPAGIVTIGCTAPAGGSGTSTSTGFLMM